jgi:small redox-active disulfide protein 2
MINVKILGTGCSRCKVYTKLVQEVIAEHHIDATTEKVEDYMEIMSYNIMTTPALVIDGVVRAKGRILSKNEILELLKLHTEVTL